MTAWWHNWTMEDERRYTIDDLTRMTGVTQRTVRFYVQRGLIPPPTGRGRGRHYGEEHLAGIQRVLNLKRAGKKLDDIKMEGRQPQETVVGSTAPEETSGCEVTRVLLAKEGIWLEIEHGASMPEPATLDRLAGLCRQELGLPDKDPAPRFTIVSQLSTVLFIRDGLGDGRSLRIRPSERLEVSEVTPAIEKAVYDGHIRILGQPE